MIRIGHGMDVHRLVEGRKLILCGVEIPHTLGLLGHSDADVAAHALMDALLGAAALGDIGKLFPDTDERYRGADSLMLLDRVMDSIRHTAWAVMPFSSPSKPMPSEVVAFTLTCDTSTPMCRARWTRIWSI